MSNKALTVMLALFLAFPIMTGSIVDLTEGKDGSFGGGSGTKDDPYIIEDVWDLQNISLDLDAYYELGNDINASVTRSWKSGSGNLSGFDPIPTFEGSLHGRGFNITGLFINRSATSFVGLFGSLGENGFVKDINLVDIDITGNISVGGLAGWNNGGQISDCIVQGSVIGRSVVGGIVGYNGHRYAANVSNCSFKGKVTGLDRVGGIVGYNYYRDLVEKCTSIANVTGRDMVAGIVGENGRDVRSCYFYGSVNGTTNVGGIVGGGAISNSHYNVDEVSINGGHYLTLGGMFKDQYRDWISHDLSLDIVDYNSSIVPCEGYYCISDVQGIKDLIGFSDLKGVRVRLTSEIDLTNNPDLFIPIFSGAEIDGDNHTISNLNINISFSSYIGLIGYCYSGIIKNVNLVNASINGGSYIGGIAGWINGRISNCSVSGRVRGGAYVGGLVGSLDGNSMTSSIDNSSCDVDVVGGGNVGGCGGYLSGNVLNCYSHGDVAGEEYVGGFVGWKFFGIMRYCYSTGRVKGETSNTGGFCGRVNAGWLYDCFFDNYTSGMNNSIWPPKSGRNTTEMMRRSTFEIAGWNFTNTWGIADNKSYPFFKKEDRILPIAYAGPDLIVNEDEPVTFDGGSCWDNIGIQEYRWIVDDREPITLRGAKVFHIFKEPGLYQVVLNVTDGGGHNSIDIMNVTVMDITCPVANAGKDLLVDEDTIFSLDGNESVDNVGIANYSWSFDNGVPVSLEGPRPECIFDDVGFFTITLNVTDFSGFWDEDTVNVTVRDITFPIAQAGPDLTIRENEIATFDGSSSTDNVGIASYTWTIFDTYPIKIQGVRSSYRFNESGIFRVMLNVTDGTGRFGIDELLVIVDEDDSPIAYAGPDIFVDEGSIVTFNGGGCTDDIGIVHWIWTIDDGEVWTLYSPSVIHLFEDPGQFTVTLKVFDRENQWSVDSLTVFVNDTTPPEADAGLDRFIDEGKLIEFKGEGSYDNVGIEGYLWTFFDGKPIELGGPNPAHFFDDPGSFEVTLRVSDAAGNFDEDSVLVTVLDITAPFADAGPDQNVPLGARVEFNGSFSSDNGRIVNCLWTFNHRGTLHTLQGMEASFHFDEGGTYEVTLKVLDGGGNTGYDTLRVNVIDFGRVTGFVFDEQGKPVIGATFEAVSAGRIFTTVTSTNGSFTMDLPMGGITWKITKEGYDTLSGKAIVEPMKTTFIDPDPMSKEDAGGSGLTIFWIVILVVLAIPGIAISVMVWRRNYQDKE
jgi:PKD repeat protein